MKITVEHNYPQDKPVPTSSCGYSNHNFIVVPIPLGIELVIPKAPTGINYSPFGETINPMVAIPILCTKCGEPRKVVY